MSLYALGVALLAFALMILVQFVAAFLRGKSITLGLSNVFVCAIGAVGVYLMVSFA
jgi:hypothetical protein